MKAAPTKGALAATLDWGRAVVAGWDRFWFTPQQPHTLAAVRILGGAMLLYTQLVWTLDLEAFLGPQAWLTRDTVALMNQTAREYQLRDTHFMNPHGLDEWGHYSTPFDLAIMLRAALNYQVIRDTMQTVLGTEPLADVEYVSVADARTLDELDVVDRPALASLAVRFGSTRLIDNELLDEDAGTEALPQVYGG